MAIGASVDADAGWTPLILSTIAGMSTCLGALIVFCHPIDDDDDDGCADNDDHGTEKLPDTNQPDLQNRQKKQSKKFYERMKGKRKVSPSTMAFSLALAGSVMVTVSVVSIGPECLAAASMPHNSNHEGQDEEENSFFVFGITLMPIFSWVFLHRLLSFGLGSFLYFLMSKYAFPEPEEILSAHSETLLNNFVLNQERRCSAASFDKSSDDEHDHLYNISNLRGDENLSKATQEDISIKFNNDKPSASLQRRMETSASFSDEENREDVDAFKNKGIIRRSSTKKMRCCTRLFAPFISYLRIFATGSDLATSEARRANRVAMLLFFSLLLHNFPEGLAVAASALESDKLGLTVTVGIMIHNIPEGIAIAIPCLKARPDSPWFSFFLASVSGLAEPAGAFLSLVLLRGVERRGMGNGSESIGEEGFLENVLAFVAGIMITVSILELFPEAKRHAEKSSMNAYYIGIIVGFIVMVATEFGMSL